MNVFYITAWPVHSGLSSATAWPSVRFLAEQDTINSVIYFTVETDDTIQVNFTGNKIRHVPVKVSAKPSALKRLMEELNKYKMVFHEAKKIVPDLIICRGSPSGMIGRWLGEQLSVPFVVESFEPHADYMYHAGVWCKFGARYIMAKLAETSSKRHAKYLITVSDLYREYLVRNEGLPKEQVLNAPCAPDYERFYFNANQRKIVRRQLNIGERLCICYVGKFGGLYYNESAFRCMRDIFDILKNNAFFIVLTETNLDYVKSQMASVGIPFECFYCKTETHEKVNRYLSASDFALSFFKNSPFSFACSPIKHGEYWASGMPVIMAHGIGEESSWVYHNRLGIETDIHDSKCIKNSIEEIRSILLEENHRERIRKISRQRRSFESTCNAYEAILRDGRDEANLSRHEMGKRGHRVMTCHEHISECGLGTLGPHFRKSDSS